MRFGIKNTTLVKAVIAYVLGKKQNQYDRQYIDKTASDFIKWYRTKQ